MKNRSIMAALVLALLIHAAAVAETRVWNGVTNGDWFAAANWTPGDASPQAGDTVRIAGGSVVLGNDTAALAALVITNATLTCTNWFTTINAATVTVENGGVITHYASVTNAVAGNTNRVHIVCTDLTVAANGKIDVSGRGYGGTYGTQANTQYYGEGPGRGFGSGGGGYGGRGGIGGYGASLANSGFTYGSAAEPANPGSGGGGHNQSWGTPGGGAVRIEASGTVTVDGMVSANGSAFSSQAGAGAGGSIWITCNTIRGAAGGSITARGGAGGSNFYGGHNGGGGRVAIYYAGIDLFYGTRSAAAGSWNPAAMPTVPAADGSLLTAYTGTDTLFTVAGSPAAYGSPSPYSYWYRPLPAGTVITNEVAQHVPVNASLRRWCVGWTAATNGVVFAGNTTTQAVFTLPASDTTMTWNWTNQYALAVVADIGGIASTNVNGWYTNGLTAEISATATGTFAFAQWNGDIPVAARFSNPLTVTMDQARTIYATFVDTVPRPYAWRGNGAWWSSTNWVPRGIPNSGSPVTIASGTMLCDAPFAAASLVISNGATMRMQRWDSVLTIGGDVDIYGTLTHLLCDTNPATGGLDNTNRIVLLCTNLTVHPGGAVNANAVGYRGAIALGNNWHQWGQGPGAGYQSGGGGYGGSGGVHGYGGTRGAGYGSAADPDMPGSGGGAHNASDGCHGGGLVRIEAANGVTINGTITADGQSWFNNRTGAGSGGGILIKCRTLGGSNGVVSANGGLFGTALYTGASGGGGRIAIHYDPVAQAATNLVKAPLLRLSARSGWGDLRRGDPGTIWLTDSSFFPGSATTLYGGQLMIDGLTSWSSSWLVCSNDVVVFPAGCALNIAGDLTTANDGGIEARGPLTVGGNALLHANGFGVSRFYSTNGSEVAIAGNLTARASTNFFYSGDASLMRLTVGGNCLVTNGAMLQVTAGIAPAYPWQPGAAVDIAGELAIAGGSMLSLQSHPTNGASPYVSARRVVVAAGGSISADGGGFGGGVVNSGWGYGPGGSYNASGGSHGGLGGVGSAGGTVGATYGDQKMPLEPGSGGGRNNAASGRGGGLVKIVAIDDVTVNGAISAVGQNPYGTSGAGAGGAINIVCRIFDGAGLLSVAGGGNRADSISYGGAGGGGRIAVARVRHRFSGTVNAAGGTGYNATRNGAAGTVVWIDPPDGTILVLR